MVFHDKYFDSMDGGYSLSFSDQGIPTSPMTPNQIQELGKSLNMGVKNVEVGTISPENFETIPIQHFEEMKRLAKLSDSKISVHAPLIDLAGFTQQGWNEENRRDSEFYFKDVLDRAHKLDPEGNIPVVIHSTGAMIPGDKYIPDKKGRTQFENGEPVKESIVVVNRETGQLAPLTRKKKYSLHGDKDWSPEEQLSSLNNTQWENRKLELASGLKQANEIKRDLSMQQMSDEFLELQIREKQQIKGEIPSRSNEEIARFDGLKHELGVRSGQLDEFNKDIIMKMDSMVDDFKKAPPIGDKKEYKKHLKMLELVSDEYKKEYGKRKKSIEKEADLAIKEKRTSLREEKIYRNKFDENPDKLFGLFSGLSAPELHISSEDFHKEKVSDTVSAAALHTYSKYGDKSPIIAIENMYGGDNVLSRADNLKGAILESRKKFAKKLVKEKRMNKKSAKRIADNLIGATWDVGHANMLRKHGFSEKEIISEAKKIAPVVKHVHLTDNFGYADSHLAPGMGNVPIKDQLKEMEKINESAKNARKIVESGAYAAQFKDNPVPYTLENMNSPVYAHDASPNWSQLRDVYGSYMYGFGDILPDVSFKTQGAGFSKLPKEMGGQMFDKGKFAGNQGG
jgi:sugar phosphate isomerase/epimerase